MFKDKWEEFKDHIERNQTAYISGAIGIVLGGIGTFLFMSDDAQIIDSFKFINWKSPHTSQTIMIRRGHPGNVVRCIQTGELFASQNRAAKVNDVNAGQLAQHLAGKFDSIKGLTFEKLGEAS